LKPTAPTWCITKPDATKLVRGIEDAITNAGLWRDDAQVARQFVEKSYADTARVEVTIRKLL
jgi:Holliday junction resolvase RusA-like endonuclease